MAFHLGKRVEGGGERVEYEPKHLTTHGLVFGMTGSGKTGLCVGLLEEAGRENLPVIAIDPKGDLANLALCWPDLAPQRFAEWADPAELSGGGPDDAAAWGARTAQIWRDGLAREGIDADEIGAYRASTGITVYTPGSSAGVQVSMLDRFAPPPSFDTLAAEDQGELVGGVVSAVLGLVAVDADPLQSREYILLSNLLHHAWSRGQALDLPTLIQRVATPPFDRLGVFDLEEFFPDKRRKAFAMQLNGLVASPSFQPWLEGVPLDVGELLARDPRGSRTSIFSIAHLDDGERMAFVALLLDRVIGWMRAQPGTGELRALLYMDEVYGYLPPHPANPPSKRPLLTLLKQARAFGLGVVLATQNPVDIDYKAITNAGTWFVGRLQTEQDKDRILDGLMSASSEAGFAVSKSELSRRISALEGRQFLLQNAHARDQVVFSTRFVRSFLRGPMTKPELSRLKANGFYNLGAGRALMPALAAPVAAPSPPAARPSAPPAVDARFAPAAPMTETHTPAPTGGEYVEMDSRPGAPVDFGAALLRRPAAPAPALPGRPRILGLDERVLVGTGAPDPALAAIFGPNGAGHGAPFYRPALLAEAELRFQAGDGAPAVRSTARRVLFPLPASPGAAAWVDLPASLGPERMGAVDDAPAGRFAAPPAWVANPADRERVRERFARGLVEGQRLVLPACPPLARWGEPGESLEAFKARLTGRLSEATGQVLGRLDSKRSAEAAMWDKQVAETRELLAADKREIAFLRERGDEDAASKAADRARFRIERYKELLARRERFLGLHDRDMADVEFSALDKLESCRMVEVRLDPRGVTPARLTLLWVPSA